MRFAEQFAQHLDVVGRDVGLRVGLVRHIERRLARKDQHTHRSGVVGHLYVGVDAVADHDDLRRLQSVAREDAREHVGIGFPERDVRTASGGVLDAGADRTAVYEHRRQVGGAPGRGWWRYKALLV